jgi:hypothetical protein
MTECRVMKRREKRGPSTAPRQKRRGFGRDDKRKEREREREREEKEKEKKEEALTVTIG